MALVVAVDGSAESTRALASATDTADAADGSVMPIPVIEPDVDDAGGGDPVSVSEARDRLLIDSVDAAEREARTIIDEVIEAAAELGQDASGGRFCGEPVRTSMDFAGPGWFETITVGHRGGSERTVRFVGSLARDVIERATVPVTVLG